MKLCETVDIFAGSNKVRPGGRAYFAIWLSASGGNVDGLTVTLVTKPTSATPHFTVCPTGHTKTCSIASLNTGTSELQAGVAIPRSATNGEHVTLKAKVTSTKPKTALSASATITVVVSASSSPTDSATASPNSTGPLDLSGNSLPLVPVGPVGPVTSASAGGNIGSLLPSIPATTPGPSTAQAPYAAGAAAPAASVNPLNRRLMGTQLIALAALCAAVGIVIAKLTLRTPRPAVSTAAASGDTPGAGPAAATAPAAGAETGTKASTTTQDSAATEDSTVTEDIAATSGNTEAPSASGGETPVPPSPADA